MAAFSFAKVCFVVFVLTTKRSVLSTTVMPTNSSTSTTNAVTTSCKDHPSPTQEFMFHLISPEDKSAIQGTVFLTLDKDEFCTNMSSFSAELKETKARLDLARKYVPVAYFIEACTIGIHDYHIPDKDFTASSSASSGPPHFGRLNRLGPCWTAETHESGQWLQVALPEPTSVTGIVTQGNQNAHHYHPEYVTSFLVLYGNDTANLSNVTDPFGNIVVFERSGDRNQHFLNKFPHAVVGKVFRVVALTFSRYISLRMEFITC